MFLLFLFSLFGWFEVILSLAFCSSSILNGVGGTVVIASEACKAAVVVLP